MAMVILVGVLCVMLVAWQFWATRGLSSVSVGDDKIWEWR